MCIIHKSFIIFFRNWVSVVCTLRSTMIENYYFVLFSFYNFVVASFSIVRLFFAGCMYVAFVAIVSSQTPSLFTLSSSIHLTLIIHTTRYVCFYSLHYFYFHRINSAILLDIIEQNNKIEIQQQSSLTSWLVYFSLCALTKCAHSCGNYSWSLTVCSHAMFWTHA